jgi:hypothetical protein
MAYENNTGYPSVTDVLSPYIDKRWFKPVHRKRGTYAHNGMSAYANCLWFPANRDGWNGYIESGKRWFDKHIDKILWVERRLKDDEYRLTGQLDVLALMRDPWKGQIALIDWKTGVAEQKTFRFQTGGYMHLGKINGVERIDTRIAVRLRKEGSKTALHNEYKEHDFDISIILQLTNCYHALGVKDAIKF